MTRITLPRQIGLVVREKRESLALTQQQLADAANVSRGFINRIEKGAAAAVYPAKLLTVLDALDLALYIEDAADQSEDAPKSTDAVSPNALKQAQRLMEHGKDQINEKAIESAREALRLTQNIDKKSLEKAAKQLQDSINFSTSSPLFNPRHSHKKDNS